MTDFRISARAMCSNADARKSEMTAGACEDTVNPVSGFIYAENEEQAVNYGIDFIMKYAGDNLLLEDNSILLLDDNRPMDLYYDFSAVDVG